MEERFLDWMLGSYYFAPKVKAIPMDSFALLYLGTALTNNTLYTAMFSWGNSTLYCRFVL